jgi:iron-sulfur cluster assembly accessory protein
MPFSRVESLPPRAYLGGKLAARRKDKAPMTELAEPLDVRLSDRAARRIAKVLSKEPAGAMLRVAVNGGGCSGFQYAFEITREQASDDLVLARDGATVLIDPISVDFLHGAEIDFVDDLMGQAFRVNNPNATASCGCGVSFSV